MDIKFLIPIVLSIISIIGGIINFFYTRREDKIGLMFQNWQVYFEENKEKIRQQEKITDNIFNKLNSRAGLIPYFNIILDDSKIKEENGKIYLGVSLINIGKESATNVGICLTEERKEIIVEGYDTNQDSYIVYNYLDKYYAMVGDKISFSIVTDRKEKIMNVFLRFKIQYYDLIGNRYEQEFRFAFYDDFNGKNKTYYSLNNISDLPKLVGENKYE
ncbi:hypothetical protein [Fusobacterium polymorphum]|uniref:hypothetical protein n=1 Tax=Fusobacterium nucleatum subsp. polymorphum TaxID=76857 RepID=UPI002B4BB5E9|nr:hypothetical protein [Fusobacterium polymorphum]WRL75492.1 hypothetical protein VKN80_00920 [Fusobacterium polymorphum]